MFNLAGKEIDMRLHRPRRGFTLLEILVVIVIISMLAALVAPRVFKGLGKSKTGIARSKIAIIEQSLGHFKLDTDRFPSDEEGLMALVSMPGDVEDKWDGPYLKKSDLEDPWGRIYDYRESGGDSEGGYIIVSYGRDGTQGGRSEDQDVSNVELEQQ